jgi:hypothetical protein
MSKIDVIPLVARHLDSLRDHSTGERSWSDVVLFFGIPLTISAVAFYFSWLITLESLNSVLGAFAIFAGLLFNLLLLIYTFSTDEHPKSLARVRGELILELHDNIAYSVLVSIFIVLLALLGTALLKHNDGIVNPGRVGRYLTAVITFLIANFFLTLLMILKRIHTMLRNKLDKPNLRKAS